MAAKITKLTAAQESRLVEFREEWLKIGLCCEPADFATGDEVIRGFYRRLGKPDPLILHFSSPAKLPSPMGPPPAPGQWPRQIASASDGRLCASRAAMIGPTSAQPSGRPAAARRRSTAARAASCGAGRAEKVAA